MAAGINIIGRAIPWNVAARFEDGRSLAVLPEAFDDSIQRGDVELWINHRPATTMMARQRDRSLYLYSGETGLMFDANITDPSWVNFLRDNRHRIRGCSIGWRDEVGAWEAKDGVRVIPMATLIEISIIVAPMEPRFSQTAVSMDGIRIAA